MPAVTPSGLICKPIDHLRTALANVSAFQAWVGEATSAAAKDHILYFGLPEPDGWTAAQSYQRRDFVTVPGNTSFIFECTVAGAAGASAPTWPAVAGGAVADNEITWTARTYYGGKTGSAYNSADRAMRPYAIVGLGDVQDYEQVAAGAQNEFATTGRLSVDFIADVAGAYEHMIDDALLDFGNDIGGIIAGLLNLAGRAGYIDISAVSLQEFSFALKEHRKDEGFWAQASYAVSYRGWIEVST